MFKRLLDKVQVTPGPTTPRETLEEHHVGVPAHAELAAAHGTDTSLMNPTDDPKELVASG